MSTEHNGHEINNNNQVDNEIPDYSFKDDFIKFSFVKKFFTIILLPLIPIHIISKGLQRRKWKKIGGPTPPSAKKDYIILSLVYIFTGYPLGFSLIYVYLQIFLFPISLLVAIYLNRLDFEPMKEKIRAEEFTIIGFRKLSFTFIFLLFFTWIFTIYGVLWFIFALPTLIFILFPRIYKRWIVAGHKILRAG
jgi:hypothetical protein